MSKKRFGLYVVVLWAGVLLVGLQGFDEGSSNGNLKGATNGGLEVVTVGP